MEDAIKKELEELKEASLSGRAEDEYEYGIHLMMFSDDTDEVSSIITVIDDSKVDFNKAGKYSVSITASDSSGNQSNAELQLYVYEDYSKEDVIAHLDEMFDNKYYSFGYQDFSSEDLYVYDSLKDEVITVYESNIIYYDHPTDSFPGDESVYYEGSLQMVLTKKNYSYKYKSDFNGTKSFVIKNGKLVEVN